jgi:hypothetical protein
MSKKVFLFFVIIVSAVMISSCGSNRSCGGKRDCNGNKKTYNKSGGFWM